jgi:Reverse transcriptase (RNA-dependent DNA polymerase)
MPSLIECQVWEEMPRPLNAKVHGTRWVHSVKGDLGHLKHMARFVVKGCQQTAGADYDETFAPTVTRESLRCLIFIACHLRMSIRQLDVKTAFLNGNEDRCIYIELPDIIYPATYRKLMVGQLKRSLYRLHQAPMIWADALAGALLTINFQRSEMDNCVYYRYGPTKNLDVLRIYVDNIL